MELLIGQFYAESSDYLMVNDGYVVVNHLMMVNRGSERLMTGAESSVQKFRV